MSLTMAYLVAMETVAGHSRLHRGQLLHQDRDFFLEFVSLLDDHHQIFLVELGNRIT